MVATSKAQAAEEDLEEVGEEEEHPPAYEKYLGVIVAFIGAWTFAITSVFNRKLKEIDYTALMVYHGLIGVILSSAVILIEGIIKGGVFRFYSLE